MAQPPRTIRASRRWGLAVAAVVVVAALGLLLHWQVEPRQITAWLAARRALVEQHPAAAVAAYFAFYLAFAALSLPGAWAVSVAGGALFGAWLGPPLVAVSSTAGATVAMLASRYLLRDMAAARFPDWAARVQRGVERDGARWLFAARLTPVAPYFAVNIAVGLTRMPASLFAAVTCIGVFPLSLLYALAGAQFARIERASDVFNLPVVAALLALAAAPFLVKGLALRRRDSSGARPGGEAARPQR